jgi:hypothetical protein
MRYTSKRPFFLAIIFLLLVVASCIKTNDDVDLGKTITQFNVTDSALIAISHAQYRICYKIIWEQSEFAVALNDQKRINFISTKDPKFSTPEGVRVNMTYEDLLKIDSNAQVIEERGWATYVVLESGWKAGFANAMLEPGSKVRFIFKR